MALAVHENNSESVIALLDSNMPILPGTFCPVPEHPNYVSLIIDCTNVLLEDMFFRLFCWSCFLDGFS